MRIKNLTSIIYVVIFFLSGKILCAQSEQVTIQNLEHSCIMPDTGAPNDNFVKLRTIVKERMDRQQMPCATINVNYQGFGWTDIFGNPNDAQISFQLAVDIWENLIDSPVTINIDATFEDAGNTSNLGSASPAYRRNIVGSPENILYPAALYEAIVGINQNGGAGDIDCNFNSARTDWFFPTEADQPTPGGQFNFTSVVLHELGHGLGITGFGRQRGGNLGYIRRDINGNTTTLPDDPQAIWYSIWDSFIESSGTPVLNFTDPSTVLLTQFTSDALASVGPIAVAQNGGVDPKTYAPGTFSAGSSYSHWDEATFNGTETALMTPFLGPGESVYDPGNVTLGFMEDMGWTLCQGTLSANEFTDEQFQLSPNPFMDHLEIQLNPKVANDDYKVRVIDITGKTVFETVPTNRGGKLIIDQLGQLPASIYFLKLTSTTSGTSITKKVVRQ